MFEHVFDYSSGMTTQPQDNGNGNGPQQPEGDQEVLGAQNPSGQGSQVKDPEDWVTGDEPMTDSQRSYLDTLARDAGQTVPADLTKAQASEHIDRLQAETGRGNQN